MTRTPSKFTHRFAMQRIRGNSHTNAYIDSNKLKPYYHYAIFDNEQHTKLPAIASGLAAIKKRPIYSSTKGCLQERAGDEYNVSYTKNPIQMQTNSSYIRAINDYTVSSHQIFTDVHGTGPTSSVILNIKQAPFTECDNIISDVRAYMESIGMQQAKISDIRFIDDIDEEPDDYTVYKQVVAAFVGDSGTIVVEALGGKAVVTVTVLTDAPDSIQAFVDFFTLKKPTYKTAITKRKDKTFYTIASSAHGFELEDLNIKTDYNQDIIDSNYNDDFFEADAVVRDSIDSDKRGLILLHGIPGSGKTSYIKHLITGPSDRKIVYIPTHLTAAIASPNFISFVKSELSNSVLVIEDAEQVLLSRESGESSKEAVSNILNMTDGILAEALNLLIICTFNTDMQHLDKALLRKGRLLLQYQFKELSKARTDLLTEKLYGKKVGKSMPLSDIYNLEYDLITPKVAPKVQFGFIK